MVEQDNSNYKPLVSIIINCFNGEKFLNEALSSVLNQTYENWEVIFWDNQSSDNSKNIFLKFNEKRFKYYLANDHTPLYKARNKAIEKSQGDILAFLDTDDWWTKDKLEKQVKLFKSKEIGLVYSNCYLFYEDSKKKKIFKKNFLRTGNVTKYLFKSHTIGILTVLIRKEAYDSVSEFNNNYNIIGDFDIIVRLSLKWKFDCIQEPLAYYRIHSKNFSLINSVLEIKEFENWIKNEEIILNKDLKPYLHHIREKIIFLKTLKDINEGKIKRAIKNIIFFPLGLNKIKLFLHILLPRKFINK